MSERLRFTKGRPFSRGDILRFLFKNLSERDREEVLCVILSITRALPREQSILEKAIITFLTQAIPTARIIQTAFDILEFTRKKGTFQLTESD